MGPTGSANACRPGIESIGYKGANLHVRKLSLACVRLIIPPRVMKPWTQTIYAAVRRGLWRFKTPLQRKRISVLPCADGYMQNVVTL